MKTIPIREEQDIVTCRRACREAARELDFNLVDQTRITTAASELARNIYEYAGEGEVVIEQVDDEMKGTGLCLRFIDHGPGIENIGQALGEGWSSHRGMGLGLPGSRRLMDDFSLKSVPGEGTKVTVVKWCR